MTIPKRTFLRGIGVSLALPAFESLGANNSPSTTGEAPAAKRFVCVAPTYGVYPGGFYPSSAGSDYEMPEVLATMERHRKDMSVVTGLDHPGVGGGHGCSNTFLNGINIHNARKDPAKLESLDQRLAREIGKPHRFPSLTLGSGGISWTRAGVRIPSNPSPERLFNELFLEDSAKQKAQTKKHFQQDGSILDALLEDSKRLSKELAAQDRDKLDQYLTSVRGVEEKLQRRQGWIDRPKPKAQGNPFAEDADGYAPDLTYPLNMSVFYDVMALALQSDSTRVITYSIPGGNGLYPFEGITKGYHQLTHHGKNSPLVSELMIIEKFFASEFARFLDLLKETKDAEGNPLLDSTIAMFGSGMGNASSHSSRNLPMVLAGGGFQHGKHHDFRENKRPMSDLYVSVLQKLGVESDQFATSTGNLNHLL